MTVANLSDAISGLLNKRGDFVLYETEFFALLGNGRGRDREFGGWGALLPYPNEQLDWYKSNNLAAKKQGRGRVIGRS